MFSGKLSRNRTVAGQLCRALFIACVIAAICSLAPTFGQSPPPPDPTLLPVATTSQVPLTAAYNALNVPSLAAGATYLDPTTGVKIYKLTSSSFPTTNSSEGHDYAEGGNEISLPYNGDGVTRAIHVFPESTPPGHWIFDFNPSTGVSNPRQLTGTLAPDADVAFSFSSNPATPYYAWVANGTNIIRIDIRTMTQVNGNGWPVSEPTQAVWLHQSENDAFWTWMRGASVGSTVVGYEPSSSTLKTYTDPGVNEPRIDRAGRYIALSMNVPLQSARVWDWLNNVIVWTSPGGSNFPFAHHAGLRDRYMGYTYNDADPGEFWGMNPTTPTNTMVSIGGPNTTNIGHTNGNWVQHPTSGNLDDQWSVTSNYGSLVPTSAHGLFIAPGGLVFANISGGRRLLGHSYNTSGVYQFSTWPKMSSDGFYAMFTSNMNGSARSDVFLAELPPGTSVTTRPNPPKNLRAQ